MTRMFQLVSAATALSLCLGAAQASAQPMIRRSPEKVITTGTVQYRASELGSEKGVQRLLFRIEAAADYVCGGKPNVTSDAVVDYDACHKQAVSEVLDRIGSPALMAAAEGQRPLKVAGR